MKERGILFKPEMIRAILEGRKTMTRRVVTKNNSTCGSLLNGDGQGWHSFDFNDVVIDGKGAGGQYLKVAVPENETRHRILSRFEIGDLLYVKEAYKQCQFAGHKLDGYDYLETHKAWLSKNGQTYSTGSGCEQGEKWISGLFMPKIAARIWLKITDIKVERVNDISQEDALKEGIFEWSDRGGNAYHWNKTIEHHQWYNFAETAFENLWIKVNGKQSWEDNPYVWCITFEKIEKQ